MLSNSLQGFVPTSEATKLGGATERMEVIDLDEKRAFQRSDLGPVPKRMVWCADSARLRSVPCREAAQKPHARLDRKLLILCTPNSHFWMPIKSCFWALVR